jgi:hypothetical protein
LIKKNKSSVLAHSTSKKFRMKENIARVNLAGTTNGSRLTHVVQCSFVAGYSKNKNVKIFLIGRFSPGVYCWLHMNKNFLNENIDELNFSLSVCSNKQILMCFRDYSDRKI